MSEVVKRDKQLRLLAQLYATIKRDAKTATPAVVKVWSRQLATTFEKFEATHDSVLDRAGLAELEEQHKIYDDANEFFMKASVIVEELLAGPPEPAENPDDQLRVRQVVAAKRLTSACQRIANTVANMQLCEVDMERTGIDAAYTAMQQMVMDRIAAGADDDEVLGQEDVAAERYRTAVRQLAGARAVFVAAEAAAAAEVAVAAAAAAPAAGVANAAVGMDALKLPPLQITPFDGQFSKWEAFRESFEHGVHARVNMVGVQKLQFLKSVLRGEPEELIQNFALTNDNYLVAWNLLRQRYNNEIELVTCHLRVLTSLAVCGESSDDLRRMSNRVASSLLALRNLGRPVAQWDDWVVFHVGEVVDKETRRMWKHHIANNDAMPTWAAMDAFLQTRIRALASDGDAPTANAARGRSSSSRAVRAHHGTAQRPHDSADQRECVHCGEQHLITFCSTFRNLSVPDRRRVAADKSLCFVCLAPGHRADACTCSRLCMHCGAKHNSMLHVGDGDSATAPAADGVQPVRAHTGVVSEQVAQPRAPSFLATAVVHVRDVGGGIHAMRALLDQGAEASMVSERAALMLQLPRARESVTVEGLGGVKAGHCKQSIVLEIGDQYGMGYAAKVNALIMPRVTGRVAQVTVRGARLWPHVHDLLLADPDFMDRPTFDILLGTEVYGTLLRPGLRQCAGLPTAQNTMLGWIVSGAVSAAQSVDTVVATHHAAIDEQLARFWEMEEPMAVRRLTVEEEKCEQVFEETVSRDAGGRIHVRLPMKHDDVLFGESQRFAVQRQLQIERKFTNNIEFAEQYRRFMEQYIELGHMREVVGARVDLTRTCNMLPSSGREYYIPHHAVIKEASTTTKLRVVFDASRRSTNGVSLNEQMMVGPRLQDDLTAILMRWRGFPVAFCADVEKMYRQIVVDAPDDDLQRIVWRSNVGEPMKVFRLCTVTYGTASAPYLAVKSLQTLARLERARYPIGAKLALSNFYVDDVLGGADTVPLCIAAQGELNAVMASGGMALRKWASNSDEVLAQIPPDDRECQLPLQISDDAHVSMLGMYWNPGSDDISFKVNIPSDGAVWTKRSFLSAASRLYDPLGWLAPCMIVVKIMFQSLWKRNLEWDDALPAELALQWDELRGALHLLRDVRVSRWIGAMAASEVEIHGFCDASLNAYAAVVMVRVQVANQPARVVNLCAKTKVAPVKTISLPRLELCGAVLLSKLIDDVLQAMKWTDIRVHCWTDSTIVLAWLRGHPSRFNVFVANRTAEIQRKYPVEHWRHVVSADNPADCASRGIPPQQLLNHSLWWTGPAWLRDHATTWPQQPSAAETNEEARTIMQLGEAKTACWELMLRYSSWRRLTRITAWCVRFTRNCRTPSEQRMHGVLQVAELAHAREFWVRTAQVDAYAEELRSLRKNIGVSKSSSLRSLNPVLSAGEVMCVGGRLANANEMTAEARMPAIVPRRSALSALLVRDAHEQTMHGGPALMLSYLRRAFWIVDGPNEVRRCVQSCTVCFRYKAKPEQQLMAALPAARVVPSRPFRHCAMDYSGAIMVRSTRGRGHHATKAYVAVFVCLATKAAHVELVGDLTTAGFIAAYERFTARRGCCSDLYSDNATNFVGAAAVFLRSERERFDNSVRTMLATKGTTWHFSPPLSPHFNGLAESAIRSVKHHIRRVVGETTLTAEELTTVLAKIEACLNSRPLCPLSSDPECFDALTPGHFLIGEPLTIIPQKDVTSSPMTALTRWQLTHSMVQRFWSRWSTEYLHTLQQRRKWQSATDNAAVGELVLIIEDNQPPAKWVLGRIVDTHPGSDGNVRVVTIRAKGSTFKRSVVKIARLPIDYDPQHVPVDNI